MVEEGIAAILLRKIGRSCRHLLHVIDSYKSNELISDLFAQDYKEENQYSNQVRVLRQVLLLR